MKLEKRAVFEQPFQILVDSLIGMVHQNLISNGFLKASCLIEFEIVEMNILYSFTLKPTVCLLL